VENKYKFGLLIISVLWAIILTNVLQLSCNFTTAGDEGSYLSAAKKLYFNLQIDEARPLIFAAITGVPFLFGCAEKWIFYWIFVVNFICWLIIVLLIFDFSKSKIGIKRAFTSALIFIFCLGNLAIVFELLSESVFILFLLLTVFQLDKFLLSKKIFNLTLALTFLSLSILIKPVALYLFIGFFLFYIRHLLKILTNKYSLYLFMSCLLLFMQMWTLRKNYGDFTVSYITPFTYYNYLGSRAQSLKDNTVFEQGKGKRYTDFCKLSNTEQSKVAKEDLKKQLTTNTLNLAYSLVINLTNNSSKGSVTISESENIEDYHFYYEIKFLFKAISKAQNIFLSLAGILLSIHIIFINKKAPFIYKFISVLVLYIIILSAISSDQGDRFHIVTVPFVVIMIFYELSSKKNEVKKQCD
jgi:hypothetical protein